MFGRSIATEAIRLFTSIINPRYVGKTLGYDAEFGMCSEYFFRELFLHERNRIERSDKFLFVIMLDLHRLFEAVQPKDIAARLSRWMEQAARESDIKGWLRERHTAAIVYTEVMKSCRDPLLRKNKEILSFEFGSKLYPAIDISCMLLPEHRENGGALAAPARRRVREPALPAPVPGSPLAMVAKRMVDIAGSSILLISLSPLLLLIAAGIKCTSKGPVLFIQKRVGESGRLFSFIKFRTMVADADDAVHRRYVTELIRNGSPAGDSNVYKISNDPRVTPLGRLLRKMSLDELPQLFNVLKGDMSLVGPRPALPYEIESYRPWHLRRLFGIKPGLTGVWQVEGRSRTNFDTMVRMDLNYIRNWSLLLDFKLLFKTVFAMYRGGF